MTLVKLLQLGLTISFLALVVTNCCFAQQNIDDQYTESIRIAEESYKRRSERLSDGSIDRTNIELAVSSFKKALEFKPDDLSNYLKLIESLYFLGHHVSKNQTEKERIYSECVDLANKALSVLSSKTDRPESFLDLPPEDQAKLAKTVPNADGVYFWSSISIGLWGMTYGNFASARNNVAGKIRNYSSVLISLNPTYKDGGGYRLLGRLYTVAPKIPFFTGWISREDGVQLLEKAYSISTKDLRNGLFLGEALLKFKPERRQEAVKLLNSVADSQPSPDYLIEDSETIGDAKKTLAQEIL